MPASGPGSLLPTMSRVPKGLIGTMRRWQSCLVRSGFVAAVGVLVLCGCAETARPAPDPQQDAEVRQRAFTPRRSPTVATKPDSTVPWAILPRDAAPSPTAAPTTQIAQATPAAATPTATSPSPAPEPTPTAAEAEHTGPNQAAFVQVGTGENHACAVRSDGSAQCWGDNDDGQLDLPSGVKFRQIASGWRFSCGTTTKGTLACWGRNEHQQASPPDGEFTEVAAGWDHACAIGPGGAACWGRQSDGRTSVPPEVDFVAIGAGAEHSCGLTSTGDLTCWGRNDNGRADSRPGPFRGLAVGVAHTCVLREDGTALCQGQGDDGGWNPPATAFDHLSAGDFRTCGTLATGQVECWDARPSDAPMETFGPPGAYTSLSVGWHGACAINEVGQIACWSSNPDPFPEPYNRLLVVNAFPDIELAQPVELTPWPAGGLLVADKTGSIAVLSSEFGSRPLLDLTDVVYSMGAEMGMLSAAVDPDFERSPFLYVYYTLLNRDDDDPRFARLSRFPVEDGVVVREQELIILDIERHTQAPFHWGGAIRFGPDEMLYLGIGDSLCRECAQNLDSWHGKIIRIDVRGATAEQPYRIPEDNPLLDTPLARPEIWAYGLRNPWRMAFDALDGEMWIGDAGSDAAEEVSIATPGANLGWPYYEGHLCSHHGVIATKVKVDRKIGSANICQNLSISSGITMPLISYTHVDGCAVIGGIVYRGNSIHQLNGAYLFGDYCRGRVWALDRNPESGWHLIEIADLDRPLSSFGIDADGEVFMTTFGGPLVRLVQTQLGYADSVTHKVRVTTVGAPLEPRLSEVLRDRAG